MTANPKYYGRDSHHLQKYLKDKRDEARFQTLREQAKNKTSINPKHNGKDSHLQQQYLKDKRVMTTFTHKYNGKDRHHLQQYLKRAGERGWTIRCRA